MKNNESLGSSEAEPKRSFRELLELSECSDGSEEEISSTPLVRSQSPVINMNEVAAERFISQQLSNMPAGFVQARSGVRDGQGVWTKQILTRGMRYGPFLGKWSDNSVKDQTMAWEIVSNKSGVRGWLDAGDMGNWLRYIQVATNVSQGNLKHVLIAGTIYYETTRDIKANEELLLVRKVVIDVDSNNCLDDQIGAFPLINKEVEEEEDDNDDEVINRHQCLQCDKKFLGYDLLDEHLISSHGFTPGQFRCEYCSKGYAWRANLIQHKTIHGEYKRYPCENCSRIFTDPAVLQKHIRQQHVGARAHACPECGKTFGTSSGLKQHTHIHSSVKPFQCEVCCKAYTQFSNLCRHKRMHADCRNQIKCTKCGQAFSTVTSQVKHKRFCDTAPSLLLQHQENKFPPHPTMMYRPPLPLLNSSLLSNYPLFPSLVGSHHHPLLTPSLLQQLPFHGSALPKLEDEKHNFIGRSSYSSRLEEHSSSVTPETVIKPSTPSPTASFPTVPVTKDRLSPQERRESPKSSDQVEIKIEPLKTVKKEVPLDLTTRRKPGGDLFEEDVRPDSTECHTTASPVKEEPLLPKPKTEFRISEILKDSMPSSSSSQKTPSPPSLLAYPRPMHPTGPTLLDMYRNSFDRQLERSPLQLPSTVMPHAPRYPSLFPHLFHPSTLGYCRSSNFEALKAHLNATSRNYNQEVPPPYNLMASHLPRTKDRYSCKFCGKVFPRSANLTRHLRTHTGEQPYKCKYCERSFSISSNLQRHVRNIHNKEKPYKCPLCDRSFGQQTNLDRHLKKHEVDGPNLPDSPEAPDSSSGGHDSAANYFSDEIRSFVDKVMDPTSDDLSIEVDDDDDDIVVKKTIDILDEGFSDLNQPSKKLRIN